MPTKRLNIEIPWQQYERLQREASTRGTTISRVSRDLIAGLEKQAETRGARTRRDGPLYFRLVGCQNARGALNKCDRLATDLHTAARLAVCPP